MLHFAISVRPFRLPLDEYLRITPNSFQYINCLTLDGIEVFHINIREPVTEASIPLEEYGGAIWKMHDP